MTPDSKNESQIKKESTDHSSRNLGGARCYEVSEASQLENVITSFLRELGLLSKILPRTQQRYLDKAAGMWHNCPLKTKDIGKCMTAFVTIVIGDMLEDEEKETGVHTIVPYLKKSNWEEFYAEEVAIIKWLHPEKNKPRPKSHKRVRKEIVQKQLENINLDRDDEEAYDDL
jgi:hypothetical protein